MEKIEDLIESEFIPVLITLIDPTNEDNTRDIKGFIFAQTEKKYYVQLESTYIADDADNVFGNLLEDMSLDEHVYGLNKILVYKTPKKFTDSYLINIQGNLNAMGKKIQSKPVPDSKGGSKKRRPKKTKKRRLVRRNKTSRKRRRTRLH
jgi:hypothetical protein